MRRWLLNMLLGWDRDLIVGLLNDYRREAQNRARRHAADGELADRDIATAHYDQAVRLLNIISPIDWH